MAFLRRFSNILVKPWGGIGKHVTIGLSSSRLPLFQSTRSIFWKRLYIGGLDYTVDEQDLRDAFRPYGRLIDVSVIRNRNTRRSRGFGFITYVSGKAANKAILDLNGQELYGRRIKVCDAWPHPKWGYDWGYESYIYKYSDPLREDNSDLDEWSEALFETFWSEE